MAALSYTTVRIPAGQQASEAVDMENLTLCAVKIPAAFTGTSINFSSAETLAGTYSDLYKAGSTHSEGVAASKHIVLDPADFAGVAFLKVNSGSVEAADRTLTLISRNIE